MAIHSEMHESDNVQHSDSDCPHAKRIQKACYCSRGSKMDPCKHCS